MELRARMGRLAGLSVVFVLCAALFSCAGAKQELPAGAGPLPGLPGIPLDVPGHAASDVHNAHIDGAAFNAASTGVIVQGSSLLLFTGETNPPSLEWAIYSYDPDETQSEVVSDIDFTFSVSGGDNAWIGIANYTDGTWEFGGPFTSTGGGPAKGFSSLDAGGYTSPAGNLYFFVAAYNGSSLTINGIDITSDVTPPVDTFSISGRVTDSSTGSGIQGVTVRLGLPANQTMLTDANGDYSFIDLAPGSYNVSVDAFAGYDPFSPPAYPVVLGPDAVNKDFEASPTGGGAVTYETGDGILKQKINQYCITCHSSGGGQQPFFTNWAQMQNYDQAWPNGSYEEMVQRVMQDNGNRMPPFGSPERAAIIANGDQHWWQDWEGAGRDNGGFQQ